MGAVIGLSSTHTQCQAGRQEKVNYALSTSDNTEVKEKKAIRRVANGLSSSLNLLVSEIQSRGGEDRGNLAQIQELQPSESHCENCLQLNFESVMFSEGMLDVASPTASTGQRNYGNSQQWRPRWSRRRRIPGRIWKMEQAASESRELTINFGFRKLWSTCLMRVHG